MVSAPYLTTRPKDGILTGGGRWKFVLLISPEFEFMDRISDGGGSVDARFSRKKVDSRIGVIVVFGGWW